MKFCFFGSGIYDSLTGHPLGGSELQVALLARALANDGHEVYLIENSKGSKPIVVNGVHVLFNTSSSIKILRFIFHKLPNMIRFLKKIKPDFIYVRGINHWNIIPLVFSKLSKSCYFIQALPSDVDTFSLFNRLSYTFSVRVRLFNWVKNDLPSSIAYPFLKYFSDILLCQHSGQYNIESKKRKNCYIFKNIYDKPIENLSFVIERDSFLYIGSMNKKKGINELVHIVSSLPSIKFKIIGKAYGRKSKKELDRLVYLGNVQYLGHMPNNQLIEEIRKSKALINVSKYEGFPNTFLEAWASGVPVISLSSNPGNIIIDKNLGFFADGNIERMKSFIENFNDNFSELELKNYVIQNHSYISSSRRFMDIIKNAINQ